MHHRRRVRLEATGGADELADCSASPSGACGPSVCFNGTGDHNDQCVFPRAEQTPLRYADGTLTRFVLDRSEAAADSLKRQSDQAARGAPPESASCTSTRRRSR